MIYIVSGFCRSGTSAMMRSLVAGGMTAAWSEHRDKFAASASDEHYHMNEGGLYEVPLKEYAESEFPLQYQGKLIKVMSWGIEGLAVNKKGYRVVLMRRDREEIRQSCDAALNWDVRRNREWVLYDELHERRLQLLHNRNDVLSVNVVQYGGEFVADPIPDFNGLFVNEWPVDPVKAAKIIDKRLYRFNLASLTVGI